MDPSPVWVTAEVTTAGLERSMRVGPDTRVHVAVREAAGLEAEAVAGRATGAEAFTCNNRVRATKGGERLL